VERVYTELGDKPNAKATQSQLAIAYVEPGSASIYIAGRTKPQQLCV